MMVEVMALMEGLDAALGLGIRSVTIITGYRPLYNHVCHDTNPNIYCPHPHHLISQ